MGLGSVGVWGPFQLSPVLPISCTFPQCAGRGDGGFLCQWLPGHRGHRHVSAHWSHQGHKGDAKIYWCHTYGWGGESEGGEQGQSPGDGHCREECFKGYPKEGSTACCGTEAITAEIFCIHCCPRVHISNTAKVVVGEEECTVLACEPSPFSCSTSWTAAS